MTDMLKPFLVFVLLLIVLFAPAPQSGYRGVLAAADSPGEDYVTALVVLRQQANLEQDFGATRAERQQRVIVALQTQAYATQGRLRGYLADARESGAVGSFTPLWIQNALLVSAPPDTLEALAALPEVGQIIPEQTLNGPAPIDAGSAETEPNIELINAPALWALGLRGAGVVVASLDTGVDAQHPDLAPRFRGGANSWYDPYRQHPDSPVDLNGHGTETTGVMVGGNAGGVAIGVAPDAQWIAAKIFNDRNQATTSAIHLAYQWLLDPDRDPNTPDAPHVANNSWTYGAPGCSLEFEPDLAALEAAGIVSVFAAGNFGPGDATDASPANNPSALAVGATDVADAAYSGSSRGPANCGGEPRTFPHLAAPGVDIRTATLHGQYGDGTGTSLAAPHTTGTLALLLGAYPDLSAPDQRAALEGGAVDLGPAGADNTFGAGRIDAQAAYDFVRAQQVIFADDFESGDLAEWTGAVTGDGALAVAAGSGLDGSYGMQARVDGGPPLYVSDASPTTATAYNARFYFSPNGVTLPRGQPHRIFAAHDGAGTELFAVQLQYMSRRYAVRAIVGEAATEWRAISSGWHALEIGWQAADGRLELFIDGALVQSLQGLNNEEASVEEVRLGLVDGASLASAGTPRFDDFVSTPGWEVGP